LIWKADYWPHYVRLGAGSLLAHFETASSSTNFGYQEPIPGLIMAM